MAQISASIIPGKVFEEGEAVNITTLNQLGNPTVNIEGAVSGLTLDDDSIVNAKVNSVAAIALTKLAHGTDAQVIVGNSSGVPTYVTASGDVTITNAGVTSIEDDAVTSGAILDDAVTYAKIQNVGSDQSILGRVSGADGVVEELTKTQVLTMINVSDGADVTNATTVEAAGALMDSEVAADLKTLSLPANTTITDYGATLVNDADAATARSTLDVDAAGTDNSPTATIAGSYDYITAGGTKGHTLTLGQIDLAADVTGNLPDGNISSASTWNGKQDALPTLDSGKFLTNNGSALSWDSTPTAAENIQIYTSGSGTFPVPAGVTKLKIQLWGGGGTGAAVSDDTAFAGGGCGGAYLMKKNITVTAEANLAYDVGDTKAAYTTYLHSYARSPGLDGNDTTFTVGSTVYKAEGGKGGDENENNTGGKANAWTEGADAENGDLNISSLGNASTAGTDGAMGGQGGQPHALYGSTAEKRTRLSGCVPGGGGAGGNDVGGTCIGGSGAAGMIIIEW